MVAQVKSVMNEECPYLQRLLHLGSSQLIRAGQEHPLFRHHWGQACPEKKRKMYSQEPQLQYDTIEIKTGHGNFKGGI